MKENEHCNLCQLAETANEGSVCLVPIANSELVAMVCDHSFYVSGFNWHLNNGYAATKYGYGYERRTVYLHQMVMNFPTHDLDHRNSDRLDCRCGNLRPCNDAQNQAHSQGQKEGMTSKFRGVSARYGKWKAQITGKRIHLGSFTTEIEAAEAYNVAALQLYGEFAQLNII